MSYTAGANLLLARSADLPFVLRLAADGRIVGERFIRENESSYKLDGKVQASLDRNAAVFADIAGWALYLQGDLAGGGGAARRSGAPLSQHRLRPTSSTSPSCRARRTISKPRASTI